MTETFRKLSLNDQKRVVVLDAPESFESELESLVDLEMARTWEGESNPDFVLAFVQAKSEIDRLASVPGSYGTGEESGREKI